MPDCQLRPATADDAPIVYALICELKQAEFDHQRFTPGIWPTCGITICATSWPSWTGRSSG